MKHFLFASLLLLFSVVDCLGDMAFVANLDGNWDLFTVDDQGENLTRLTQTPYDEKDPAWSPDRKMLVYATSDGAINIMHVASKETMQIKNDDPALQKYGPVFSTDGNRLAYAQANKELRDDTDLVVYDLQKKTSKVFLHQVGIQMWPAWSPDGKHLAYTSLHCNEACGRFIQELWLAGANGKWAKQLLMTNSFCKQPAWSPDSARLAFSSDKAGNFDIYVLHPGTGLVEQITTDSNMDESPAWSPDGKRIAFVSTNSGIMQLWIKNLDSGELKMLRPFGDKVTPCKDVAWW